MPQNEDAYTLLKNVYLRLPHSRALGLGFARAQGRNQVMFLDWQTSLRGNVTTEVIHGGAVTTLVDVVGAVAVAAHLPQVQSLATLDLRIDYLFSAKASERIFALAECYRLSGQVAFVRTTCFQSAEDEPFALGMASYMRSPMNEEGVGALRAFL